MIEMFKEDYPDLWTEILGQTLEELQERRSVVDAEIPSYKGINTAYAKRLRAEGLLLTERINDLKST
jgi:hypothetical protein